MRAMSEGGQPSAVIFHALQYGPGDRVIQHISPHRIHGIPVNQRN